MATQAQDICSTAQELYERRDDFAQANSHLRKQIATEFDMIGDCLVGIAKTRAPQQEGAHLTALLVKVFDLIRFEIRDWDLTQVGEQLLAFRDPQVFLDQLNQASDKDQHLQKLNEASEYFKSLAASIEDIDSRRLRIVGVDPEFELVQELDAGLTNRAKFFFEHPGATMMPELAGFTNLIIVLGSAGVFTAVYQIICKYMERHKDHEITFEKGGTRITVKGHSIPDEHELLKQLFPEGTERVGVPGDDTKSDGTRSQITEQAAHRKQVGPKSTKKH